MDHFKEIVKESIIGHITESDIVIASEEEFYLAMKHFNETGECKHEFVKDVPGWLYDTRYCEICGRGLGAI